MNQPPAYIHPSAGKCSPRLDMTLEPREYGHVRRCVYGYNSVPALDAGGGDEQDHQLGHLQRDPVAYPFFGCEVHLVKASTLGGIMSGRWKCLSRTGSRMKAGAS